jgi:hypothetical protein
MGPQHANRLQDLLEQVLDGNQVVATEPVHIMEDITKPGVTARHRLGERHLRLQ